MPKKTDNFFDDELDELDDIDDDGDASDETTTPKKEPPAKKPDASDKADEDDPDGDKTDWKAKYEAAEAEKLDRRYLDELLRFDDTLEGDALDEIEGGARYRELRGKGLSARAAYAALLEEIDEAAPDRTPKAKTSKNHMSATSFRSKAPKSRMDRTEKAIIDDLLPDVPDEEKEKLYRRVNGK